MKRQKIKQSLYRILMSEVLPYELPLIFTNNKFYQIADKLHLFFDNGRLTYKCNLNGKSREWADAFVSLLNGSNMTKSSFNYYINKTEGKTARELVIVHPFMQLKMMEFYKKYDSLMLNFCQKSNYSLRFPYKRATFLRPKTSITKTAREMLDYKANDIPKHYFYYKKYENINAFYEGREFQKMESRFTYMYKADIRHCFDMIPILELPRVLYQADFTNVGQDNFASIFALMMKEMNVGRKPQNRIVKKNRDIPYMSESVLIGPEFSRIFAEMFFQQIDVKIEKRMASGCEKYELHHEYECFRYVDDIFFFYNDKAVYNKFYGVLISELNKHNGLRLNYKKNQIVTTPFINEITIAKRKLRLVIEKILEDRLHTTKGLIMREEQDFYDCPLKMEAKYMITDIKTIIKQNNIKLGEVSANLLAYLHRNLGMTLDETDSLMDDYRKANEGGLLDTKGQKIWRGYEMGLVYYFHEMIKFLFYLFNSEMRMNTSIRVLSILNMIVSYCQGTLFDAEKSSSKSMSDDAKNKIYKSIIDELTFILKHNRISMLNGLEICNLMLILKAIPENYDIDPKIWDHFIGDTFDNFTDDSKVNVLMALTLLMIFGRNNINAFYRHTISKWLMADLKAHRWSVDDTESLMVMINVMTSPFVDKFYKDEILNHVDRKYKKAMTVIGQWKSPFMQWSEFKLTKACLIKYSAEVY